MPRESRLAFISPKRVSLLGALLHFLAGIMSDHLRQLDNTGVPESMRPPLSNVCETEQAPQITRPSSVGDLHATQRYISVRLGSHTSGPRTHGSTCTSHSRRCNSNGEAKHQTISDDASPLCSMRCQQLNLKHCKHSRLRPIVVPASFPDVPRIA